EVVLFAPLTRDDVRLIAKHYLEQIAGTLARSGKTLEVDEEALERLVTHGHSLAFGARFLKRVIDEQIKLPIMALWREGSDVVVHVEGGALTVRASHGGIRDNSAA